MHVFDSNKSSLKRRNWTTAVWAEIFFLIDTDLEDLVLTFFSS